ncbi:MAG TPA: flagellar cap protein FliD N-terminal domain-containing protein, partial [Candidatus Dormibacteraeota bacterium]|nr:flagellar cap protein FliD N-terminal domain-containing protein [Candidatus Dormibacteraeota bacterium]
MSSSQIPGTNVPPVSFPGIVSGIDYNSIIQKLTSLTLAPTTQINSQIATLNAANLELIKINNLLSSVQSSLGALSQPNIYDAVSATSTNLSALIATGISGGNAVPGVYTIDSVQVATPTSIASNTAAGHNITDALPATAGIYAGLPSNTVPLADSYAAITPTNGSGSTGSVTIDGISVSYDVNTQSLNTILANIQTAVQVYDPSFTATLSATGTVTFTGSKPITLGSANDQGNLLDVLQLSGAQINNVGATTSVTGTAGVGGINQATTFDSAGTDAGFVTPVTSGNFTINGVSISVDATGDNLASVLAKINASNAGVVATYDSQTGVVKLTNKSTGAQSIVVGSSGDTSNFLTAVGLTSAAG